MNRLYFCSTALVQLERWISRWLVFAFVALIVINVGMRYVLGQPLVFAEELAAILLVWLAFFAASITIYQHNQIGVTLLVERLPAVLRHWVHIVVTILMAAILAVLLWYSLIWVLSPSVEFEQIITLNMGKAPFFWIVPIFSLCALFHVIADLVKMIGEGPKKTILDMREDIQ